MKAGPLEGLVYGVVLAALAFMAAGAGHGTYIPMAISSAPFGLFGVLAALGSAPILWALLGAMVKRWHASKSMRALVVAQYLCAFVLISTKPFNDWRHVLDTMRAMPEVLAAWTAAYVGGQVVLWISLLRGTEIRDRR